MLQSDGLNEKRFYALTLLGVGSSSGVPMTNGNWGAASSKYLINQRTRAGVWLRSFKKGKIQPYLESILRENTALWSCNDSVRNLTAYITPHSAPWVSQPLPVSFTPFEHHPVSLLCSAEDFQKQQTQDLCYSVLIDAGPEIRAQALSHAIKRLDHIILTHEHFDHVAGLPDLAPFKFDRDPIPVYTSQRCFDFVSAGQGYLFSNDSTIYKTSLQAKNIVETKKIEESRFIIEKDLELDLIDMAHGQTHTLGLIEKSRAFAFTTDVKSLTEQQLQKLKGTQIWILDCSKITEHPSHVALEEILYWNKLIQPKKMLLTHLGYHVDYYHLQSLVPDNVIVSHDGLTLWLGFE